MQRRFLRVLVLGAVLVVVAFGVPLTLVTTNLVRRDAVRQLQREVDALELALTVSNEGGLIPAAALDPFISPNSYAQVISPSGVVMGTSGVPPTAPITVRTVTSNGTVIEVSTPGGPTRTRQREAIAAIAAVGLVIVALATATAMILSRRLARPVLELSDLATRLGRGDTLEQVQAPVGPDEVRIVAEELRAADRRIAELLRREREFASNASHQLRTALTALRLHLDEAELEATHEGGASRLAPLQRQLDRLDSTVEELLGLARPDARAEESGASVGSVARERVAEWAAVVRRAGRELRLVSEASPEDRLGTRTSAAVVGQLLDILIDNALRHGSGTVSLTLGRSPAGPTIRIHDDGPGILAGHEHRIFERGTSTRAGGSGIGLALAKELVERDGGRLVLVDPARATFEVFLAAAPAP
ncbi:MAG: HAMP domain-containing sensor histidine kinase [Ilumatobacteraceae bacterium]